PLWPVSSTIDILTNQLVYVTFISLLVACLISFYLSIRITRPIRTITRSAERLGRGEYGIIFRGGHYTEINNLADTLTQASIELEKSDMLQKDLIANVSHDLRTPLTMIKSYAEMIRDLSGDNPAKREQHLQVIIDETDRLNSLVGDLLSISRLQSGKMVLEKSDFNITHATESIINTYKIMEIDEGYTFNFNSKVNFIVNGDEEKIKQVISNLFTNAIKFAGEDKTVNVTIKRKGRVVLCKIEDHGIGIAAEELDHVWERYYRASSNMARPAEGSGLGLSIVKEILTLHKVDFGVESTEGKGTTFWFELPHVKTGK
ncbi:MAG: HAMP domain-containing histidine kinase, partial [Firmicutes bacterium]|nr:HAMP domain-containing histidine kinase [Bacillota bacterium]